MAMYESTPSLAGSLRRDLASNEDPWMGLLDDASFDARRTVREQEKWDRSIDSESATWLGLLVTLCENGNRVAVKLNTGVIISGLITLVGTDVVGITTINEFVGVAVTSIVHIESEVPLGPPDNDRIGSNDTLRSMIQRSAEDRDEVALILRGRGNETFGQLRACGVDICTITNSDRPNRYVYIPTDSIVALRRART
jgi:hypothetical protein